ncbi:metal ABC transporter permease [Afifella sp. IM 167]|uniref:metal ABC transporter permease n=1 Tax=Afifella sp. IM 167 TaxID=2033586 RepID=UPI001CCBA00F|nr:metal ABC transporter permease [Afifella sp. IM 167]MBZ8134272.1 ABC transporter [Afifella sp. IM 167]
MNGALAFLSDYTIQNVAFGAAILGTISGVLGVFAVLRQQSLLGDALSHAALPGICLGFLLAGSRSLPAILAGALLTGILAALVILVLTSRTRLKTDAAIGISLSVFFAAGVVLLTYIQGTGNASQGGLDTFLFGQAAAILRSDLYVMGAIALVGLGIVAAFWKEFKLVTFDPDFAGSLGMPVRRIETALTLLIALAVVVGLQMVGVVLMAAMVIAPAVAARQWARSLGAMVTLSALAGIVAGASGALLSSLASGLATGPLIVLAATLLVIVSLLFAPQRGILWSVIRRRRAAHHLRGRQVLATIHDLASAHHDTSYPAEQSMLDAYHGLGTGAVLSRLEGRGLVRRTTHMPQEGPHWELTEEGRAQARESLGETPPESA